MISSSHRFAASAVAATLLLAAGVASAHAQGAPLTLPPPGYMEPGAASGDGGTKRQPSGKARRAKADEAAPATGAPRRSGRRADPEFSDSTATRPRRFVPEEFDNGDQTSSGSARPIMTDTGRAGVGMRF